MFLGGLAGAVALGVGLLAWREYARHRMPPGKDFDGDDPAVAAGPAPSVVPPDVESLDSVLEPIRAAYRVPALAAGAASSDRILALGAVGVRRAGGRTRVTPQDRFHIGSCGKAMTATLVGTLIDDGRLAWGTTLEEVFADRASELHPETRGVTVHQLLAHAAGLPDDRARTYRAPRGGVTGQREHIAVAAFARPPSYTPGTGNVYANRGFVTAGAVAERITGETWETLITERVFRPLGMSSAGFGAPGARGQEDQPWGHALIDDRLRAVAPGPRADNPAWVGPAGRIHVTIADWLKFARLHLRAERGEAALLTPETFAVLHGAPWEPGFALGWGRGFDEREGLVFAHSGSNGYWVALVRIMPEQDLAVVVATNIGGERGEAAADEALGVLRNRFAPPGRRRRRALHLMGVVPLSPSPAATDPAMAALQEGSRRTRAFDPRLPPGRD